MPLYVYKAVDRNGLVVRNRVEEINRYILLKKIKKNGFMPIEVTQIQISNRASKMRKKHKKNVEASDSILKTVRQRDATSLPKSEAFKKKLKQVLFSDLKINNRDIVIFTQDFYLLKKANFNNIQALSTIIESTENQSFISRWTEWIWKRRSCCQTSGTGRSNALSGYGGSGICGIFGNTGKFSIPSF